MKRVAFDFSEEAIQELDNLMKKSGVSTRKDLFNEAMNFFEYCLDQVAKTGEFPTIKSENGVIEIAAAPFVRAKKEYEKQQKAAKKGKQEADQPTSMPMAVRSAQAHS